MIVFLKASISTQQMHVPLILGSVRKNNNEVVDVESESVFVAKFLELQYFNI